METIDIGYAKACFSSLERAVSSGFFGCVAKRSGRGWQGQWERVRGRWGVGEWKAESGEWSVVVDVIARRNDVAIYKMSITFVKSEAQCASCQNYVYFCSDYYDFNTKEPCTSIIGK